ncbi:hypothetical protein DM02DRAFT_615764 [Periconia macrospinosa]|uniref:Uncharacterized protein n=1 Tax=Periconia macrospinosa TaxID=97972 RepID=A0A2V1DJW2_9PLEO|nr:hypothetical protein DM02DRAFT_615764 [Periconia macrospinosa]
MPTAADIENLLEEVSRETEEKNRAEKARQEEEARRDDHRRADRGRDREYNRNQTRNRDRYDRDRDRYYSPYATYGVVVFSRFLVNTARRPGKARTH